MQISTQNYLRSLDTDSNGLTIGDLKKIDANNDNFISSSELGGNGSESDLAEINSRYSVSLSISTMWFGSGESQEVFSLSELDSDLFPNGVTGISAKDIRQGGAANAGDCYFLASIASLAEQNPHAIVNMIDENPNGTYTVTFPGDSDNPITVSKPTQDELNNYAKKGSNGSIWAAVLEKAFSEYTHQENWFPEDNPRDDIGHGGWSENVIELLTNHSADEDILSLTSNSTTRGKLKDALSNGRMVTADRLSGDDVNGLPKPHTYTVLAYNEDSDTITLRNPWGHTEPGNDGVNDGIFVLTLDEFNDYFNQVTYEEED